MYTTEQMQKLACDWCGSWPCVCEALGIGRAAWAATRDHRKARKVSVIENINATYAAGLRTGEQAITVGSLKVSVRKPAKPRKRQGC